VFSVRFSVKRAGEKNRKWKGRGGRKREGEEEREGEVKGFARPISKCFLDPTRLKYTVSAC